MKKFLALLILILCIACGVYLFSLYNLLDSYFNKEDNPHLSLEIDATFDKTEKGEGLYSVYINDNLRESFDNFFDAVKYAEEKKRAIIKENKEGHIIWSNYPDFSVIIGNTESEFANFSAALQFASSNKGSIIIYKKTDTIIWEDQGEKPGGVFIEAPMIKQLPELARGCEVTSLAMLLNYNGITVDKMELAEKIHKNPNEYSIKNGIKYSGNPHRGFVGDIYNFRNHGLGVYNEPIFELLSEYTDKGLNYTGCDFSDLYYSLNNSQPIWVIINTSYSYLPESSFETWLTEDGEIKITYKEHSVLVTGYDENYIYFNDPYGLKKSAPKKDFIEAWVQMGSQAIGMVIE